MHRPLARAQGDCDAVPGDMPELAAAQAHPPVWLRTHTICLAVARRVACGLQAVLLRMRGRVSP
jgi:hypothetical protein